MEIFAVLVFLVFIGTLLYASAIRYGTPLHSFRRNKMPPRSSHFMVSPSQIRLSFGQRVRELRKAKEMSQKEFASLCGLDRTYISGIERGKRNVSLQNIHVIARALEVRLVDIFDGIEG